MASIHQIDRKFNIDRLTGKVLAVYEKTSAAKIVTEIALFETTGGLVIPGRRKLIPGDPQGNFSLLETTTFEKARAWVKTELLDKGYKLQGKAQ